MRQCAFTISRTRCSMTPMCCITLTLLSPICCFFSSSSSPSMPPGRRSSAVLLTLTMLSRETTLSQFTFGFRNSFMMLSLNRSSAFSSREQLRSTSAVSFSIWSRFFSRSSRNFLRCACAPCFIAWYRVISSRSCWQSSWCLSISLW